MMPAAAPGPAHPWIDQWRAADSAHGPDWLAVPSQIGARGFRQSGWRGFREQVSGWAQARGLAPAALRVVSTLPPPGPLAALPREAELLSVQSTGERQLRLMLRVPFELAIFQGHFPTVPIVPGALLTGWAAQLAALHARWPHGARVVQAVKFRRIVQPGHDFSLDLQWQASLQRLDFCYREGGQLNAQGSLAAPAP
jgi:3-hydroxymyristoyl/3-hydroxydecanoyl-(acyl carrier protein) dehydratase